MKNQWGGRVFRVKSRSRGLAVASAIALSAVLAGCVTDGDRTLTRVRALSPEVVAELGAKNMPVGGATLVRIFKEENELEVWRQTSSGQFALFRTYPICRWSGDLGPKTREGDRQAPEGFYTVAPHQMNPNSQFHLSFNLGYPNAFDRAFSRSGSALMVHGDCSSRGCYAMTDEQISEIYALARASFDGGQHQFQVHALPFRMSAENLARHRSSPHMAFWRQLKEGYDHFEVTRAEPRIAVCERRYVVNQVPTDPEARFEATAACPPSEVEPSIRQRVAQFQRERAQRVAELSERTPTAPVRSGVDGGMHPVFVAALMRQRGMDAEGMTTARAPGTIPRHTVPPDPQLALAMGWQPRVAPASAGGRTPAARPETLVASSTIGGAPATAAPAVAAAGPASPAGSTSPPNATAPATTAATTPAASPSAAAATTVVASAPTETGSTGGGWGAFGRWLGMGGSEPAPAAPATPAISGPVPLPMPRPASAPPAGRTTTAQSAPSPAAVVPAIIPGSTAPLPGNAFAPVR